jgi:polysaccharide pyruvyl transferase CsaB
MNESRLNVLLLGWYGAGNIGDELLLDVVKQWAQAEGAVVSALSIDPVATSALHGIEAVDLLDLMAVADRLRKADLLVLGGGGVFQTYNRLDAAGLYAYEAFDISMYARPVLLARQMGVPVAMIGQGLGPLEGGEARAIVADMFEQACEVSVRDQASFDLLKQLGIADVIAVAPDPAWSIGPDPASVQPTGIPADNRICVVVRPWERGGEWEDNFIEALRNAVAGRQSTLVWVPFQTHQVAGKSGSDEGVVRSLMARIGDSCRHEYVACSSAREVLQTFANCQGVICMRLHAQILALLSGRLLFCIEYDGKMAETSMLVGLPESVRIDVAASPDTWNERLLHWMAMLPEGRIPYRLDDITRIAHAAGEHRRVLGRAIAKAREMAKRDRWKSGRFDWLGVWRERLLAGKMDGISSALEGISSRLKELTNMTRYMDKVDARLDELRLVQESSQASIQQQAAEFTHDLAADMACLKDKLTSFAALMEKLDGRMSAIESEHSELLEARHANARLQGDMAAVLARLNEREDELKAIVSSNSWRLTRPLRFARRCLGNPSAALPVLSTYLGRAHRKAASDAAAPVAAAGALPAAPAKRDLHWDEFSSQVLAKRNEYRGVFIQELVIDWNVPLYQRPQHLAAALARRGYLVIYKTDNWSGDDVDGFREVIPGVWLTNDKANVDIVEGAVRSVYSTAYLHTPEKLSTLPLDGVVIYEYIDHIDPQISGDPVNIQRLVALKNWAFGGGADCIVTSARKLEAEAVAEIGADRVLLVPNGVDATHYRRASRASVTIPSGYREFRGRYKTIVGYFGAIAPWLWYDQIKVLVESRPDLGFVFIGPDYYGGVERLAKADNVLYLGIVEYKVLPAYASLFDVCFIPFEPGEIARTTSPLKLFEYFALEKPVVVTSEMLECVAYPEVLRGDSAEAFSSAIDEAVARAQDAAFQERLKKLADENDWDNRAAVMERVFDMLDKRSAGRPGGG